MQSIHSMTVETVRGKTFENVKIERENSEEIEFSDKDGVVTKVRRASIKSITPDRTEKDDPAETSADESLPVPMPAEKPKAESLPEHSFMLTQYMSNDGAFQGSSLYGERDARRNGSRYRDYYQSYFLTTGIDILGLPKPFKFGITMMNPAVDRTNTDSDHFFQTQPGGQDRTALVNSSIQSGTLQYDPNSVKTRKEQNKLLDYLFTRMAYEHETRMGTFYTGFLFIHINEPAYALRGYYLLGWKPPVLSYLNPNFTLNTKMTSEYGGIYQGNHNYRLSLSHEYFKGEKFRVIPSLVIGYQDVNNNASNKRGFSDISPRLQFEYLNFFIALNYMFRTDPDLVDNSYYTPDIGAYPNQSQTDGKTVNPSKAYGYKNQLILNEISAVSPNEFVKRELSQHYQEQRIVSGIFFINLGYSVRL